MKITQAYPLLQVSDVAATAAFYRTHLGFEPAFEADWFVHLQSVDSPEVNLAILRHDHETIPEERRGPSTNVILSYEVEDAAKIFEAFTKADVPIAHDLRDEPHGQRHFIAFDPNGVLVDIITPIPPSPEFLAQYRDDAIAQ